MNVLIVHAGKDFYGGAEEVIAQLSKYLEDRGHAVQITIRNPPQEFAGKVGTSLPSYRSMWSWTHKLIDWADIINVHNFPATLAAFPTRKPIVWMCNEPPELFTNWKRKPIEAFNRWWVRKSGMKVVVATPYDKVRFEGLYNITPKVLPYGIDYEFWSQGTRTPKGSVLRLLQVGTITPYKNQIASLKVLKDLQDAGIPCLLSLAGSIGNEFYLDCLRFYIRHNNLKNVNFLGQQTYEEVRRLYYFHDILLHPVREQGGWLVPFEAMCTGLPVIVTGKFPAMELVYRTGNLVSPSEELTEVTANLIKNYDNFVGNEKAKQWVKENLTWEKYGAGMLRVFEEARNDRKE